MTDWGEGGVYVSLCDMIMRKEPMFEIFDHHEVEVEHQNKEEVEEPEVDSFFVDDGEFDGDLVEDCSDIPNFLLEHVQWVGHAKIFSTPPKNKNVKTNRRCCMNLCSNEVGNRTKFSLKFESEYKENFIGDLICDQCYFRQQYRYNKLKKKI